MDQSIGSQSGREIQTHAEFLELNGDSGKTSAAAGGLQNRKREFAAGEEAGVFAGLGHQVGFGEDFQDVLLLQSLNGRGEIDVWTKDEDVEEVAQADGGAGGG